MTSYLNMSAYYENHIQSKHKVQNMLKAGSFTVAELENVHITIGPCNLTGNIESACGIDMATHQAKLFLQSCLLGASAHLAHGRHLLHHLIEMYKRDHPIDVAASNLKTPNIQTVTGIEPETLGDLESVMDYVEEQITTLLATFHIGLECRTLRA